MFKLKRIYELAEPQDGYRVLVDRIWPRGVSKEKARIDCWMKEIGVSDALRKRFGHDPKHWAEFQRRYQEELKTRIELIKQLKQMGKQYHTVTLIFSARDEQHNQAVALRAYLQSRGR